MIARFIIKYDKELIYGIIFDFNDVRWLFQVRKSI